MAFKSSTISRGKPGRFFFASGFFENDHSDANGRVDQGLAVDPVFLFRPAIQSVTEQAGV